MMTPVTLEGFLSKKEIEASYGRSYRSLTRDITRAVKTGDTKILQHLKLVTEDEKVREGTDVTLDMIQDLSNHGMRPTWLAEETWIADWCARRSGQRRADVIPSDVPSRPDSRPVTSTRASDPPDATLPIQPAAVELLQQRVDDQRQQIDMLRGQLEIKDEQIRNANQLAQESQQLMRDLHILLKNVQDGLLGEGTRRLITTRIAAAKPPEPTLHTVVQPAKPPTHPRPQRIAKPAPRKKTPHAKRSVPAKPDSGVSASARLHRWFPTFLGPKGKRN